MIAYFNYWIVFALMLMGLYTTIASDNLVKKVVGLNVFQTSVFFLIITIGKVGGGTAPIVDANFTAFSNPLPHVLILTAIVVSVATTALALALVIRIKETYGSIEETDIQASDEAET